MFIILGEIYKYNKDIYMYIMYIMCKDIAWNMYNKAQLYLIFSEWSSEWNESIYACISLVTFTKM